LPVGFQRACDAALTSKAEEGRLGCASKPASASQRSKHAPPASPHSHSWPWLGPNLATHYSRVQGKAKKRDHFRPLASFVDANADTGALMLIPTLMLMLMLMRMSLPGRAHTLPLVSLPPALLPALRPLCQNCCYPTTPPSSTISTTPACDSVGANGCGACSISHPAHPVVSLVSPTRPPAARSFPTPRPPGARALTLPPGRADGRDRRPGASDSRPPADSLLGRWRCTAAAGWAGCDLI